MYNDETLVCKDCGQEFTFTAREQEFYAEKGFENKPLRCKACRDKRKAERGEAKAERQMYDAVCGIQRGRKVDPYGWVDIIKK